MFLLRDVSNDRFRPLRLEAAAVRYFGPHSGITGRSLASLARRGKLGTYRIGNRLFTTLADIDLMVSNSAVQRALPTQFPPAPNLEPPTSAGARDAVARAEMAIEQLRARS
jgi:hypothetical protein